MLTLCFDTFPTCARLLGLFMQVVDNFLFISLFRWDEINLSKRKKKHFPNISENLNAFDELDTSAFTFVIRALRRRIIIAVNRDSFYHNFTNCKIILYTARLTKSFDEHLILFLMLRGTQT